MHREPRLQAPPAMYVKGNYKYRVLCRAYQAAPRIYCAGLVQLRLVCTVRIWASAQILVLIK